MAVDPASAIARHLDAFWPERRREDFVWTVGPIRNTVPGMVVKRVAPGAPTDPWHYLSCGLSQIETDGQRIELVISSPFADPIHVETIAMASNFHADPRYRLYPGKVIDIGRPWIEGARCDHLLVSLPYLLGPAFEYVRDSDMSIRFLWLLPITRAEAAFARTNGADAIETAFERSGFDTLDLARASVV